MALNSVRSHPVSPPFVPASPRPSYSKAQFIQDYQRQFYASWCRHNGTAGSMACDDIFEA